MKKQLVLAGGSGTFYAIVLVLLTYGAASLAGDPLVVIPPGAETPQPIPAVAGAISTTIGGIAGIVISLLVLRSDAPRRRFLIICGIGLALFTISPFVNSEHVSTAIWLNVMHIVAAIPIVGLLAKTLPATNTASTDQDDSGEHNTEDGLAETRSGTDETIEDQTIDEEAAINDPT